MFDLKAELSPIVVGQLVQCSLTRAQYEMRCVIWYHLYNLKNVKNTHGGLLLLVNLQTLACNFNKSNTPSWVYFYFF